MQRSAEIEAQISKELGTRMTDFLKGSGPGNRICGLLTAKGRSAEWEKALEHISKHFRHAHQNEFEQADKPTHTVFRSKFRNPDTLKTYIKETASKPSVVRLSKMRINGLPIGGPCVLLIREFKEPLGQNPDEVCLFVVTDRHGTLITAFPMTKKDVQSA